MKRLQHRIEYGAVRFLIALVGAFPLRFGRRVGAGMGWIAFRVLRLRRDVALENIRASIPFASTHAVVEQIGLASYMNLGRCLIEILSRPAPEDVLKMVRFDGAEVLEEAKRLGRGGIIVSAHLGNWEFLGSGVSCLGYKMSFLPADQSNQSVGEIMNELRNGLGAKIVGRGAALRGFMRALADNEIVGLLADQDARKGGVFIDFLGRPASVVTGPATISIKYNAPIIVCHIHRVEDGRHHATYEPLMWADPSLDGDEAIKELTQRFTDVLAKQIRLHPTEYFWGHRRWKTQPAQTVV
jgi:KDO2-lipid IV(A) lauroyltransferase